MGIQTIFSLLAVVGFGLFLFGLLGHFTGTRLNRPQRARASLAVVGMLMLLAFGIASQGLVTVQPQEVGVVFNTLSGTLERPLRSGIHVRLPILYTTSLYPINQQQFSVPDAATGDEAIRARSIDGQEVFLEVSVIYSIDPDSVNVVHQRWQSRYPESFILPTIRGLVRDNVSQFRAQEIYAGQVERMEALVSSALSERFREEGFLFSAFLIREMTFSPEYAEAVEQAQIAQQAVEQARIRVEQRRQEAEQVRIAAEGARDAAIIQAEGEASVTLLEAQANAEALQLVSEQIAANPSLIQYRYSQNLGENVRLVVIPSGNSLQFDQPPNDQNQANEVEATPEATVTP
jgi:regulator of protease activity HflC (stomatin/prohibitin superfamily)